VETQSDQDMQVSQHFLAVSNDIGDVVLFQIQSPFLSLSSAKSKWSATGLCHFTASTTNPNPDDTLATFEDYIQASNFVHALAWSPWLMTGDGAQSTSIIACATRNELVLRKVIYLQTTASGEFELEVGPENRLQFALQQDAPLKWLPKVDNNQCANLIGFTDRNLVTLTVPLNSRNDWEEREEVVISSVDLDDRWDPISGMLPHCTVFFCASIDLLCLKGLPSRQVTTATRPILAPSRPVLRQKRRIPSCL
jgi:hypothetical protein